jgi:hypothetical protein
LKNADHAAVMRRKWKDPEYRARQQAARSRKKVEKKAAAVKEARETAFQVRETIERLDREELADYIEEQKTIILEKVEEIGQFLKSLLRIREQSNNPQRRSDFLRWARSVANRLRTLYTVQQRLNEAELRQDYLGYGTGRRRGGSPSEKLEKYIAIEDNIEYSDDFS